MEHQQATGAGGTGQRTPPPRLRAATYYAVVVPGQSVTIHRSEPVALYRASVHGRGYVLTVDRPTAREWLTMGAAWEPTTVAALAREARVKRATVRTVLARLTTGLEDGTLADARTANRFAMEAARGWEGAP